MRGIRAAVITVSDGVAAGRRQDTSGRELRDFLRARLGAEVAFSVVVPDERERIAAALVTACDEQRVDLVFTTGGTGMSARDVTPEATRSIVERLAPGLTEAMRWYGMQRTPSAMLSRAVAGIRGSSLIINLPGSPTGVRESLEAIVDQLPHAVGLLRGDLSLHEARDHRGAEGGEG